MGQVNFLIRDLEDRAIMSLGWPSVLQFGKSKNHAVHIGLSAGKLPVASPLLHSHLPFSVLPDLPQLLLQPARHPSLLLYPSVRFCMQQNLDPSFPALQTLKCCSVLCLRRALCRRCSQAYPRGLKLPFIANFYFLGTCEPDLPR